jgi:hypothetical protein
MATKVATKHALRILTHKGDVAVEWTPGVKDEETAAKTKFDEMLAQGFALFAIEAPGKTPEQVRVFDPKAFEIIATPQLKGG